MKILLDLFTAVHFLQCLQWFIVPTFTFQVLIRLLLVTVVAVIIVRILARSTRIDALAIA